MNKKEKAKQRKERLMPKGIPRYIRCYDNGGKSIDRYTVVYTGRYDQKRNGCMYVSMNSSPFHPQGFGQHGDSPTPIDYPTYSHLGKKIKFTDLPEDCQKLVVQDYKEIWNIVQLNEFHPIKQ